MLHVIILDIISSPSFPKIMYTLPCISPKPPHSIEHLKKILKCILDGALYS